MLGSASLDSRGGPQPIGPFRTGENATRGQAEGAQPGTPPTYKNTGPIRDCTSPGLRMDAVGVQNGATSKEKTLSEPPARSRAEVLGLDWTSSKGSRTADGQWKTALVQAAVSGSGESTGPTSADGTRGQPNAEAGTDDGGDDTRYVTGPWMQHRC
jgi:hypothetical protein